MTPVESNIGSNIGKLVESDGYLQVGIGNVFGGLAKGLSENGRQNIRIFSEMFSDPMKDLVEAGIAVEAKTGFAYGSTDLYKWLNNNQKVEFLPTIETNDPAKVSALKKFHAVNTALQVNLLGDVNATFGADGARMSSPGGQVEFMSGAARSEGGKAIIAIRSTAKEETLSTIVMDLYQGPVTTSHENVTHVVTEYGIAVLKGKTERERAINLINIAHPKFRQELFNQAQKRGFLNDKDAPMIKLNGAENVK